MADACGIGDSGGGADDVEVATRFGEIAEPQIGSEPFDRLFGPGRSIAPTGRSNRRAVTRPGASLAGSGEVERA